MVEEDEDPSHLPASHRNRLIYLGVHETHSDRAVLLEYIHTDKDAAAVVDDVEKQELPPAKKRKTTAHVVKISKNHRLSGPNRTYQVPLGAYQTLH